MDAANGAWLPIHFQPIRIYRPLSPSIAHKRKFLAVDMTASLPYPENKSLRFNGL
jgi:hypothetical protein